LKFEQFLYREPALSLFANRQKVSLFRWLTRRAPPMFLFARDNMTSRPMVAGCHEPEVLEVLAFLARSGFDWSLIDIGANVGLMTWHSRCWFRSFHCFEPNPRVFHVLAANLASAFGANKLHLYDFGLGERDETAALAVPHYNQGGAFVIGASNAYGANVLDDAKRIGPGLTRVSVTIRRGRTIFRELFSEMPDGRFVVKIDTEGFEQVIIREIAAVMPSRARIAIVFENLQANFDAQAFVAETFGGGGRALKLADNLAHVGSRLGKEAIKLTRGKVFRLTDQPSDWLGTVIVVVGDDAPRVAPSASAM
jgi:FkbM family methyltransferase